MLSLKERGISPDVDDKLNFIANSARLASVLEVSSMKPGNVNPMHNFENTRFEHFLAGSISLGDAVRSAAFSGYKNNVKTGEHILNGVSDVKNSHSGGNTHLGILMLFIPAASAAGVCLSEGDYGMRNLQVNVSKILSSTTVDDAVNLCSAIKRAKAGGLCAVDSGFSDDKFNLNNEKLNEELIKNNLNFYELMKLSKERDRLAEELTTGMSISFEHARVLEKIYAKTGDIFSAVVQTYLMLLSKFPDTLIARKCGFEKAGEVSHAASNVIELGGVFTREGRNAVENFDKCLQGKDNKLNPGTTADIVAASLFITLLFGLKL